MQAPQMKVVSSDRVFPSTPHPTPTTTPLSIIDSSVARFTPCGAIWYFPSTPHRPNALAPETLRKSLAHTLSAYPQWAGHFRMTPYVPGIPRRKNAQRYGRIEIRYGSSQDPGVEFVVAEIDADLSAALPGQGRKEDITLCDSMLREDMLLPDTPLAGYASAPTHTSPSVAVQITRFADGGTAVGIQIVHCLADATALSCFVHDWSATHEALLLCAALPDLHPVFDPEALDARAARSLDDAEPDAAVLQEAYNLPVHRYDWWSSGENSAFGPAACAVPEALKDEPAAQKIAARGMKMPWGTYDVGAPVSHAIIHYTSAQLSRIWAAASAEGASLSRHDALGAHVWTLVNRARGPEDGDAEGAVHADISIGLRKRVFPPLPPTSLGSPLQIAHSTLPWRVASSASSLPAIASSIKATLARFTPQAVATLIYATAQELAPQRLWQAFLGREHMLVTSWAHTGLYGCRFGTGMVPRYVHPIMPLVDGCVQIMERVAQGTRQEKGGKWYDEGVDVAVYLEREAMGRLVEDGGIWL